MTCSCQLSHASRMACRTGPVNNSDRGSAKAAVGAGALLDRREEEPQELGMAGGWDVGVGWDSGAGDGFVQPLFFSGWVGGWVRARGWVGGCKDRSPPAIA